MRDISLFMTGSVFYLLAYEGVFIVLMLGLRRRGRFIISFSGTLALLRCSQFINKNGPLACKYLLLLLLSFVVYSTILANCLHLIIPSVVLAFLVFLIGAPFYMTLSARANSFIRECKKESN